MLLESVFRQEKAFYQNTLFARAHTHTHHNGREVGMSHAGVPVVAGGGEGYVSHTHTLAPDPDTLYVTAPIHHIATVLYSLRGLSHQIK